MTLLFMDIDNFKSINDKFGHDMGDFVLQTLAKRLVENIRSIDTVCRLGGDEFIIILTGIHDKKDVEVVLNKIINIIKKEIVYKKHRLLITVSIGISIYPEDGKDSLTLMTNADVAMYRAKEKGGNHYQYYH